MYDSFEMHDQIYEFENNRELYKFRFKDTNLPMWMFIRSNFISKVMENNVYFNRNISRGDHSTKQPIKEGFVNKYLKRNPFFSHKKDIVFGCYVYNTVRRQDNGLIYDDLIMPYLDICPERSTVLMDGPVYNKQELNPIYSNWKMDNIFSDFLRFSLFKKRGLEAEDEKCISDFLDFLNNNFPIPFDILSKDEMRYRLEIFSYESKELIKIYEAYLKIVKPKLVIVYCGSYPTVIVTSLILACRNQKIMTAELQHGFVGKYHVNYHYSDYVLRNRECSIGLTDYFLTFGEFWNRQLKIPQKLYTIGYTKDLEMTVPTSDKILFCAGINFDIYYDFLNIVMPKLEAGTEVYFRFHPLHMSASLKKRFSEFSKYPHFFGLMTSH